MCDIILKDKNSDRAIAIRNIDFSTQHIAFNFFRNNSITQYDYMTDKGTYEFNVIKLSQNQKSDTYF